MLMRGALGAFFALAFAWAAQAQNNFPTPGGATVPGYVTMCISGNIAVPCNPGGGGGGLAAGAAVTGCPAQSSLFVTSALQLGCVTPVSETDTGLVFSLSGILAMPDTSGGGAAGMVTMGGSRFLHDTGGISNTFLGHNSGNLTYGGTNATCVGESCMLSGVSGNNNTAIGRFALGGAVTGGSITSVGSGSMGGCSSCSGAVTVGNGANGVTTAANTTVIGSGAAAAATGASTTAVGFQALVAATGPNNTAIGANVAANLTTGSGNTFLGAVTGGGITTGADNLILGRGVTGLGPALGGAIVLASGAGVIRADFGSTTAAIWTLSSTMSLPLATDATHTDATVCRDTTSGQLFFGSGAAGVCLGTSGRQFKTGIEPMNPVLDDFMKLSFVTYRYRDGYGDNGARRQSGLIAQDVEKVFPALAGHNDNGETINYDVGAVWMMYGKAIQEAQRGPKSRERQPARRA